VDRPAPLGEVLDLQIYQERLGCLTLPTAGREALLQGCAFLIVESIVLPQSITDPRIHA
jgi:hypothetical protein